MSVRGVKQLTGFVFRYSDRDGSSRGMRKYLRENIVGNHNDRKYSRVCMLILCLSNLSSIFHKQTHVYTHIIMHAHA